MRRILRNLAVGICALAYALVGLVFGFCSGFIVLKLVQLIFGLTVASTAILQLAVAGWAIVLAILAVVGYLKSPSSDRMQQAEK